MNILITNHLDRWTASKSHSFKLANWLSEKGHRIVYCGPHGDNLPDRRSFPLADGVIPVDLRFSPSIHLPITAVRLAGLLRKQKIDLIHVNLAKEHTLALFAAHLSGKNIPVVRSKHFLRPLTHGHGFRTSLQYNTLTAYNIVSCRAIADLLIEHNHLKPEKIRVIYEGVDTDRFTPALKSGGLRRELGIPESAPLAGLIASIKESKAPLDFIDAAAYCRKKLPEAHFIFAGTGDPILASIIEERIGEHGLESCFTMIGYHPDMPRLLASLDIGVVSSIQSDAAGRICLEYAASGTPAVVTDIGAYPEIIRHGKTGLVVPSHQPKQLGEAMFELLSDPDKRAEMGIAARKRAEAEFSKQRFIQQVEDIYQRVIQTKKSR